MINFWTTRSTVQRNRARFCAYFQFLKISFYAFQAWFGLGWLDRLYRVAVSLSWSAIPSNSPTLPSHELFFKKFPTIVFSCLDSWVKENLTFVCGICMFMCLQQVYFTFLCWSFIWKFIEENDFEDICKSFISFNICNITIK